jgi:DNA processing protein
MKVKKLTPHNAAYPLPLRNIASPPDDLYYLGANPEDWLSRPRIAIVGSRQVSPYGKQITLSLAQALAERGIVIISGLALGVDGLAHSACLEAGGTTVAVLANGLDAVYPASHSQLAERLLRAGGTIISEYPVGTPSFKQHFIARNRLIAGLADAVLITEAHEKSGSLHTARFALEQGKEVLSVPGNITSPTSVGTNNLIKSGAVPVTSVEDILYMLGADHLPVEAKRRTGDSQVEQAVIDLLYDGTSDGHELLAHSGLPAIEFAQVLTMLELSGKIRPLGNNHWGLK